MKKWNVLVQNLKKIWQLKIFDLPLLKLLKINVMATRAKTMGLHEWTKEDTIVTFYFTKFGTRGLFLKTDSDIAKHIGTTLGSLKMQSANFRTLLGVNEGSLSDFSKLQLEVLEEYNGMSQFEFLKVVKKIIGQDQMELAEIFKKMGKDPSKMKRVEN